MGPSKKDGFGSVFCRVQGSTNHYFWDPTILKDVKYMHTPNISCACLGPRWLVEPPVNVGIESPETNPIGLLEKVTIGPICRRSKINQWIVSIKYSNKYKISNKYPFQTHQILWFNVQAAPTPGHPVPSKKSTWLWQVSDFPGSLCLT